MSKLEDESDSSQAAKVVGWTFFGLILFLTVVVLTYTFIFKDSPYNAMRKSNKVVPLYQPQLEVFSPYLPY